MALAPFPARHQSPKNVTMARGDAELPLWYGPVRATDGRPKVSRNLQHLHDTSGGRGDLRSAAVARSGDRATTGDQRISTGEARSRKA